MRLLQKVLGALLGPATRRKAAGKSAQQLVAELKTTRDYLLPRLAAAADTPGNREAINHWVGIERWALDCMAKHDDHAAVSRSYKPFRLPDSARMSELRTAFAETRERTLAIAEQLAAGDAEQLASQRVAPHTDLGLLTLGEWLQYVSDHSRREVIRLR